jgi:hypothetical protein
MAVESRGHGQYRPPAADADVVAAIRPECAAARVQSRYPPGVAHDLSEVIECQHAVLAAVDVDKCARRVERQTPRIGDPWIATEQSDRFAPGIEAEDRTIAPAVSAARASNKELRNPRSYRTTSSFHDAQTLPTPHGKQTPPHSQRYTHPGRRAALCLGAGRAPVGRHERAYRSAGYVAELPSPSTKLRMPTTTDARAGTLVES